MKVKKKISGVWFWLLLGVAYYIWVRVTGLAIPCVFRKLTGWLCPGCGITTMILCLARLDFSGAWKANPFLFLTAPFLLAEILYAEWIRRKECRMPVWNNVLVIFYGVLLCAYGVFRNLNL